LQSANDAAVAIACHVGGDTESFADLMNAKARELGLCDTSFKNPHGLDDDDHFTTAKDLAVIASEALKNDTFRQITSTYKKHCVCGERERNYVNHNKLLCKYTGCIGVKTGFTKKSGRCLVGAAEKDGISFITVTLDAPNDWSDHEALLDLGFDTMERVMLADVGEYCYELPIIGGKSEKITVANDCEESIITAKEERNIISHIKISKFAVAPVNEGDILGEVVFTSEGTVIGSVKLKATESVEKKIRVGFWKKIFQRTE
jgi:D-alanyl-D-alanine carboxypeptidase/D-alanyl-D-alanine carboxypeptidase (penicillin-binding protein 5/6)